MVKFYLDYIKKLDSKNLVPSDQRSENPKIQGS